MHLHWSSALLCPLISYVAAAPTEIPSAASFYVHSIPHIHLDEHLPLQMYGGHLPADPTAATAAPTDILPHLYFFMVKNRRMADKERIVFWFNGGPGCSSFDGLMMEVGPWRWDGKSDHDFWVKAGGWEEYTTMVFVDQPAGTGFSYTSTDRYVHTIEVLQAQIREFLNNFYLVFPEYRTVDTYLAGESFAGQWIPYIADAILESDLNIPLRGIAIGNGWIDAKEQYLAYLDFSVKSGLIQENSHAWDTVKAEHDKCRGALEKLDEIPMHIRECAGVMGAIMDLKNFKQDGKDMCLNMYDIRYTDTDPACGLNWPPEMHSVGKFLGLPEVVSALHATTHPGSWVECKHPVHVAFHKSKTQHSVALLPKLLSKIRVLIFAGDQDLICNYLGLENMIKNLTWNGGTGLGSVATQAYSVNSQPAGTWASSRNLTYVKLFNASHMAPFDVPHVSHDMMLRFMGVNFTSLIEGTARIPSAIGSDAKPVLVEDHDSKSGVPSSSKTPQQNKAMWEAYYNAGSAALVLVIIFLVIGTFVWCRLRRKKRVQLLGSRLGEEEEEESIPLTSNQNADVDEERRNLKGKQRAVVGETVPLNGGANGYSDEGQRIFDVGDSDDEDDERFRLNG